MYNNSIFSNHAELCDSLIERDMTYYIVYDTTCDSWIVSVLTDDDHEQLRFTYKRTEDGCSYLESMHTVHGGADSFSESISDIVQSTLEISQFQNLRVFMGHNSFKVSEKTSMA